MLTKEEINLITQFDYQVLNNGMDGWLSNKYFRNIFKYIHVLEKRNNELDKKVINIFQTALITGMELELDEGLKSLPEMKQHFDVLETRFEMCFDDYCKTAKEFMASYELKDWGTKIDEGLRTEE